MTLNTLLLKKTKQKVNKNGRPSHKITNKTRVENNSTLVLFNVANIIMVYSKSSIRKAEKI